MKELKLLSEEQKDLIKAQVGCSRLYLKAISFHKAFNSIRSLLLLEYGERYDLELNNFIACTISSLKKGDVGFTMSRNKTTYTTFNQTIVNRKKASYRRTIEFYSLLEDSGYIDLYKGYKDVEAKDSMSSCCIFKDKLVNLFPPERITKFGKEYHDNSVEIRDEDGTPLEGIDTDYIKNKVDSINKWLKTHDFYFGAYARQVYLQRVYNGSLEVSGRFYFGELQTIRSEKRISFIIDKERVSELDFSSMHFCILATIEGYKLPEDFKPYDIDISDLVEMKDGYCKDKARKITKLACMMLINSARPTTSFKNVWQSNIDIITKLLDDGKFKEAMSNPFYGVSGKDNSQKVIKRLITHNSYAEKYFNRKGGMWGQLQNLDSEIMFNILLSLKKLDLPALPYHDSVVIRKTDVNTVREIMQDSWKKVLGTDLNCRIDKRY